MSRCQPPMISRFQSISRSKEVTGPLPEERGGTELPGRTHEEGKRKPLLWVVQRGLHALRTLAPGGDQLDKHYFGKKMQEPRKKPKKMPNKKARKMQTKR